MVRLKERYNKEIVPQLIKKYGYHNIMEVPRVSKIVLNLGMGESLANPKAMEAAGKDLTTIAGQHRGGYQGQEVHRCLQAEGGHTHRHDGHPAG